MKTNYPWQIDSIIHKTKTGTKTLGMDAFLFSPKEEDAVRTPTAPLEMHEGYSRYVGTLIVKTGEKKVLTFNIPAKSVPYIAERTKALISQNMISTTVMSQFKKIIADAAKDITSSVCDCFLNGLRTAQGGLRLVFPKIPEILFDECDRPAGKAEKSDTANSKAYTVSIKSGKLKDKIPAQLLIEDPSNLKALENQKKWLLDNVSKYPANQEQIDAITEAIKLFHEGSLNPATVEKEEVSIGTKVYTVYESACKNIQPMDEEGRYTIYQISIKYTPENNLPFAIEVMNCMAPVDKTKGNEIVMSKAVNKQTQNIRLSEEEWYTMIYAMLSQKKMFETLTYPEQRKLAQKIFDDNKREAAKSKAV